MQCKTMTSSGEMREHAEYVCRGSVKASSKDAEISDIRAYNGGKAVASPF